MSVSVDRQGLVTVATLSSPHGLDRLSLALLRDMAAALRSRATGVAPRDDGPRRQSRSDR